MACAALSSTWDFLNACACEYLPRLVPALLRLHIRWFAVRYFCESMSISIKPHIVFNVGTQIQATLHTVVQQAVEHAIPLMAAFQVVASSEKHPPETLEDHDEQASMRRVCNRTGSDRSQILSFSMSDSYHTSCHSIAF